MEIAGLVVGGILLVMGKRLFWLFVAAVGFITGVTLAGNMAAENQAVILLAGLLLGFLGGILAVSLQRLAILLGGFLAGAYLLNGLFNLVSGSGQATSWVVIIIGGVLGAALLSALFEWALVLLSSLVGAVLVARGLTLEPATSAAVIAGLALLGILIQAGVLSGKGS